jgi:hypothetical protein
MRVAKKAAVAAALTGAVVSGALLGATPSMAASNPSDGMIVIQGTCGQTFNPTVGGGAADWTLTCAGGKIRAQGWVKDTDADGKAAEVYGTWGDGSSFGTVRGRGWRGRITGERHVTSRSHAGHEPWPD